MAVITHAIRVLLGRPAVAAAIVVTLALGIGATTAVFGLLQAILLRPLPYVEPDRLIFVWETRWAQVWGEAFPRTLIRAQVDAYRDAASFEAVALVSSWSDNFQSYLDLETPDGAERLRGAFVTPAFFELLGVQAAVGRTFGPDDERRGDPILVISDGLWRRSFGADPAVVGRVVDLRRLDGGRQPYTIVGVLPAAFRFSYPLETEAWVLQGWSHGSLGPLPEFQMIARLRPGVSVAHAEAELATLLREVPREPGLPRSEAVPPAPIVERMADTLSARTRPGILLLFGGAALVMLIACVNVALLLLAGMVDRQREMAVRAAFGAGWWRLTRQLLVESALLGTAGAVVGVAVAWVLMPVLRDLVPASIPRGTELSLDPAVLAFTAAITILAVLLCSLPPAFHARNRRLHADLEQAGRTVTPDRRVVGLRRFAMAAQTAIVLVLLVVAALLLHSFFRLRTVDPGFTAEGLTAMKAVLLHPKWSDPQRVAEFDRALLERLRAVSGVARATLATVVPARGTAMSITEAGCMIHGVDREFFDTVGIPLVSGRLFGDEDERFGPPYVGIVSHQCARRLSASEAVGGAPLRMGADEVLIIGVVGDARYDGIKRPPDPALYLTRAAMVLRHEVNVIVRARPGAGDISGAVLAAARSVDPEQPIEQVGTVEGVIEAQIAEERFHAVIASAFAVIALLIAVAGLAGTVARSVGERTRELAVRGACGALPRQLVALAVTQGLRPVAVGLVAGLLGALAASHLVEKWLFEISPLDPMSYAVAVAALGSTAAVACYLPARRAARVDPASALRAE